MSVHYEASRRRYCAFDKVSREAVIVGTPWSLTGNLMWSRLLAVGVRRNA
jgi:hypothetical protein